MNLWRWRPQFMKRKPTRKDKRRRPKSVLRIPDLDVAKSAVLNGLSCQDAQRGYHSGGAVLRACRSAPP